MNLWLWILCSGTPAFAGEAGLTVTVTPDPPKPALQPLPAAPLPDLPVTLIADGLDLAQEAAWEGVQAAPALTARRTGPKPPDISAFAARDAQGRLGLRLAPLAPGDQDFLLLDPDGFSTAFWRVERREAARSVQQCGIDGIPEGLPPVDIHPMSMPCAPTDDVKLVEMSDGSLVVIFPPGRINTQARVLWARRGPGGSGGTWARDGLDGLWPLLGRGFVGESLPGGLQIDTDPLTGHRSVGLRGVPASLAVRGSYAVAPYAPQPWERLSPDARGVQAVHFDLAAPIVRVVFEEDVQRPWPRARVFTVRGDEAVGFVQTPVVARTDLLRVHYHTPIPLAAVPIALQPADSRGAVAQATVDLPAGSGILEIGMPESGTRFTLQIDPLLSKPTRVVCFDP